MDVASRVDVASGVRVGGNLVQRLVRLRRSVRWVLRGPGGETQVVGLRLKPGLGR